MTGPFAVIIRRSGSGWEMCAMYARLLNPNPRAIARRTSWARTRAGLMETVRTVMR